MIETLVPHVTTSPITTVQPINPALTSISGLTPTNDDLIQRKSGLWTNRSVAQYELDLVPAWTPFTPVIQSSSGVGVGILTKTINYSKYCQIGKEVFFQGDVGLTNGVGTTYSSGWLAITLPVTAANDPTLFPGVGIAWAFDASASAFYSAVAELQTFGAFQFFFMHYADGTLFERLGENVGARYTTMATGDEIAWAIQYEAA